MKMLLSLRKNHILITLFTLLFVAAVFLSLFAAKDVKNAASDEDRREFIEALNLTPMNSDCKKKSVYIPLEFKQVYNRYNDIQKEAGYDLSLYKGEKVTLYTYKLKENPEYFINLLVYKDRVIGGDISSVSLDGKMFPLKENVLIKE